MAVFPESMDRIDPNDPGAALSTIESYIRYMQERIEFANKNTLRTVSEAGVSSAELYSKIVEIANTVQGLASQIAGLNGDVTIERGNWAAGVYVVKIAAADGTNVVRRITVK